MASGGEVGPECSLLPVTDVWTHTQQQRAPRARDGRPSGRTALPSQHRQRRSIHSGPRSWRRPAVRARRAPRHRCMYFPALDTAPRKRVIVGVGSLVFDHRRTLATSSIVSWRTMEPRTCQRDRATEKKHSQIWSG